MRFSQRKLDRLLFDKVKLSRREQKVMLELASATRQLFHDVFIEDKEAPADVNEFLVWHYGFMDGSPEEHEEIEGSTRTSTRRAMKSRNREGVVQNVVDYYRGHVLADYLPFVARHVIAPNAGYLALSLAGGAIPESLLGKTLNQEPIGFRGGLPFHPGYLNGMGFGEHRSGIDERVVVLDTNVSSGA